MGRFTKPSFQICCVYNGMQWGWVCHGLPRNGESTPGASYFEGNMKFETMGGSGYSTFRPILARIVRCWILFLLDKQFVCPNLTLLAISCSRSEIHQPKGDYQRVKSVKSWDFRCEPHPMTHIANRNHGLMDIYRERHTHIHIYIYNPFLLLLNPPLILKPSGSFY